jgi:beta-glucoside operon transcriptional antiterminator
MGRGIGFKVKEGNEVREELIEKVFYMDSQSSTDQLKELLATLPLEHFELSNTIISYAKKTLNKKLNQNIYITLTDHISFAIERFKEGMMFHNPLLWEVQSIYRQEYAIGEYAVELIKAKLKIDLPLDEAASIALHLVNAEYDTAMSEVMNISKMLPAILEIFKNHYKINFDEQSLYYERFVTHLKYLAQRIIRQEIYEGKEEDLNAMISKLYPDEHLLSIRIGQYIMEHFNYTITDEELSYLTVHIRRVVVQYL